MQLTVSDAARLLGVPEPTIHRWIKQDTIPVHRINEQLRFNRAELLEWATARGIRVFPEIFDQVPAHDDTRPPLSAALQAGGIAYGIEGADKPSVLREVVNAMKLPANVDREFLFQVLLAREMLGSTGIGDGIAIPHVRSPIVLEVATPTITLCFLRHPIDFGAVDGKPVRTLFALITPTIKGHLHMLSRLAFALQNKEFRAALQRQAPPAELMAALARTEAAIPAPPEPHPVGSDSTASDA